MILLYGAMFLVLRRWIILDNGIHWYKNYNPRERSALPRLRKGNLTEEDRRTRVIAKYLLYYPLVYIFCVTPNGVCRWAAFRGAHPTYQLILASNSIYNLSGTFNLLLVLLTRPRLVMGPESKQVVDLPRVANQESGHGYLADVIPPTTSPALEKYLPQPFEPQILSDSAIVLTPVSRYPTPSASGSRNSDNYLSPEQHNQKKSYNSLADGVDHGYLAG
jgi:hypothetical protein